MGDEIKEIFKEPLVNFGNKSLIIITRSCHRVRDLTSHGKGIGYYLSSYQDYFAVLPYQTARQDSSPTAGIVTHRAAMPAPTKTPAARRYITRPISAVLGLNMSLKE